MVSGGGLSEGVECTVARKAVWLAARGTWRLGTGWNALARAHAEVCGRADTYGTAALHHPAQRDLLYRAASRLADPPQHLASRMHACDTTIAAAVSLLAGSSEHRAPTPLGYPVLGSKTSVATPGFYLLVYRLTYRAGHYYY